MTVSERASALVKPMPLDPRDRDLLREAWRVASQAFIEADDDHQRSKEGKQIGLDRLIGEMMAADPGMKAATAERLARSSELYAQWTESIHNKRRHASELKLAAADADRRYWECVSQEATDRAERKMTR